MDSYAMVNDSSGIVENMILWDGESEYEAPEGYTLVATETAGIGWSYANGVFTPPPPIPPTDEEITAANTSKLQAETQLAASQKTALTNRVGTLSDAVELEMATPEETAELPVRQAQLLAWKKYAIFLGRVTAQDGWALVVEWPVQPPEGMDLTVSAVAGKSPETK